MDKFAKDAYYNNTNWKLLFLHFNHFYEKTNFELLVKLKDINLFLLIAVLLNDNRPKIYSAILQIKLKTSPISMHKHVWESITNSRK